MNRKDFLDAAEKYICHEREDVYGSPENNFSKIAEYWNAYLGERIEPGIDAEDVALMMALLKFGRITTGVIKEDNYIDLIGYIGCAGEIATK